MSKKHKKKIIYVCRRVLVNKQKFVFALYSYEKIRKNSHQGFYETLPKIVLFYILINLRYTEILKALEFLDCVCIASKIGTKC